MIFKHNFNRTGVLSSESADYYKKVDFSTIENVLKQYNIFLGSDTYSVAKQQNISQLENISVSCTNYGLYILPYETRYQTYIIKKYIHSKTKLEKKQNLELSIEDSVSKYAGTNLNFEIKNLVILSSAPKWENYDWIKINSMIGSVNDFIKIHPVSFEHNKKFLENKFGRNKIISGSYIADSLIFNAKKIGVGASSETLITANLLNKEIVFLNKPNYKVFCLHSILYEGLKMGYSVNELIDSQVLNLIPWKYIHDENVIKNNIEFIRTEYGNCFRY